MPSAFGAPAKYALLMAPADEPTNTSERRFERDQPSGAFRLRTLRRSFRRRRGRNAVRGEALSAGMWYPGLYSASQSLQLLRSMLHAPAPVHQAASSTNPPAIARFFMNTMV